MKAFGSGHNHTLINGKKIKTSNIINVPQTDINLLLMKN